MVHLRFSIHGLMFLALLLVAAPAVADTQSSEEIEQEISTRELTCEIGDSCDGPSVVARAKLMVPDPDQTADPHLDEINCLADQTGAVTIEEECAPETPSIDADGVRLYAAIDGLQTSNDGQSASTESASNNQAAAADGLLSLDTEAALLVGALGLGASGAAAFFGARRLLTFLLAPLASRLQPSELLDNDTRRAIYEEIQGNPGINLRGLADELDLAWGTLLHHLRKLEKGHLVVSERYGKYRRFFLNGSTYTKDEQARLAALSAPSTARVAEYILENPGSSQAEIGEAIGVTASTILWHVRRLKKVDLVHEEREGRYVHYYPRIQEHEAEQLAAA